MFSLSIASINRSVSCWTPWPFWCFCMFCQDEHDLETHSLCECCSTEMTQLKMSLAGAPLRAHKGHWWQQLQRSLLIPDLPPLFLTITDGTGITGILIHWCQDVSGIVIVQIYAYVIREMVQLRSLNFNAEKEFDYVINKCNWLW